MIHAILNDSSILKQYCECCFEYTLLGRTQHPQDSKKYTFPVREGISNLFQKCIKNPSMFKGFQNISEKCEFH